jgi:hypothetical protein
MIAVHILQTVFAIVVLAEALNKLQRTDLFDGRRDLRCRLVGAAWLVRPWKWRRARVNAVLYALAYAALAIAAAGEFVAPPTLHGTAAVAGMAMLIVRKRLMEG